MNFQTIIKEQVIANLSLQQADESQQINNTLRLLSKWRCVLIQNTFLQHQGTRVIDGPFRGLDFIEQSAEGCHIPKLLGCYEQPLSPFIEQAISSNYHAVINIGCAEGYYAVGMALRMADTKIMAFDMNPKAQEVCAELAKKNGVANRITIGSYFAVKDFEDFSVKLVNSKDVNGKKINSKRVLVICDIEGAERELLDPSISPALSYMDLIVESHECLIPGITKTLLNRFGQTHKITIVEDNGQRQISNPPKWFKNLSHLDQLLAVWEWRSGPTPWLVMLAKSGGIG